MFVVGSGINIGPITLIIASLTSVIIKLTVENPTRKLWPIVENESPVAKYLKKLNLY